MADRGIIFSAPMVRALLAGTKTQTRRLLNPQPDRFTKGFAKVFAEPPYFEARDAIGRPHYGFPEGEHCRAPHPKIHHAVGDRLYVRENFWIATRYSYGSTPGGSEIKPPPLAGRRGDPIHYSADGEPPNCANKHYGPDGLRAGSGAFAAPDPYATWRQFPCIHMPRWASRLTLTVTDVRVQRLQEISEDDAIAEGVEAFHPDGSIVTFFHHTVPEHRNYGFIKASRAYEDLWNSLHAADGTTWEANPWIVALTFTVARGNINA